MRVRLSHQPPTRVTASVLVVLVVFALVATYWWLNLVGIRGKDQLWFLIPLGLVLAIVMPYRMRQYADSVEDLGDGLHIIHGEREFNLPLEQILSVQVSSPARRGYIVKLKLAPKSEFGSVIRFYGALPVERPSIQQDLGSLSSRVAGKLHPD